MNANTGMHNFLRNGETIREKEIYVVTGVGSLVNLGLFVVKLLAGIIGMSSAMIADAFHSLSDLVTDIIVVVFVKLSAKPADYTHRYGHGKFETMATVLVSILMMLVGVGLMADAIVKIVRVVNGDILESPEIIALWVALLSIIVKEILFRYTIAKGKEFDSPAVVANAWHHRSDAISSVCTALGIGGAIALGGSWTILDPIACALVSFFIIKVGVDTSRVCFDDLLERSLPTDIVKEITEIIVGVPGVGYPHHLLTRRIGTNYAIEFNMHVDEKRTLRDVCDCIENVEAILKARYGKKTHVGVHVKMDHPHDDRNIPSYTINMGHNT